MEYLRFGKTGGDVLVILPGISPKSVLGAAKEIELAYSLLAEDYDIYLLDHIEDEPDGYSVADMARDSLCELDSLGVERFHLMGVSMGGMAAQKIASSAPDRVKSLILCSTAPDGRRVSRRVVSEWKLHAAKRDARSLAAAFGESVYSPSFYEKYKEAIAASCDGATERDFHNFEISLAAIESFDGGDDLAKISCPAFVIGASDDRVLGNGAATSLARSLGCPCYIYEGYGHAAYDEAPDYRARIKDFLSSQTKPKE